jgi:hypothetical protein
MIPYSDYDKLCASLGATPGMGRVRMAKVFGGTIAEMEYRITYLRGRVDVWAVRTGPNAQPTTDGVKVLTAFAIGDLAPICAHIRKCATARLPFGGDAN